MMVNLAVKEVKRLNKCRGVYDNLHNYRLYDISSIEEGAFRHSPRKAGVNNQRSVTSTKGHCSRPDPGDLTRVIISRVRVEQ